MGSKSVTKVNSSELSCHKSFKNISKDFKWSVIQEICLLKNMMVYKPAGINKHLNMEIIRTNISEAFKINMTTKCLWEYVNQRFNMAIIDKIENVPFSIDEKAFSLSEEYDPLVAKISKNIKHKLVIKSLYDNTVKGTLSGSTETRLFTLPEEFNPLIAKMSEVIRKKMEKERLNNENIKKTLVVSGKTRSKSNSMSSVDFNDVIHKQTNSVSVKTSEVRTDEVLSSRRSLRTNDRSEDKELVDDLPSRKKLLRGHCSFEDDKKSKDVKQWNTKKLNQSIDFDKNNQVANTGSLKRKRRNVSESSFNSDNIKQPRSSRSNTIEVNISDGSSRSVTPEVLRGKSNRSVTPEIINRKSNLRSGDKDQKNKSIKHGQSLPELKVKLEKSEKQGTKLTPKQLSKIETTSKIKNKPRGRLTADLLVVQQSSEIQSMGRRSLNKN